MPWVKAKADDEVNEALERIKEEEDKNKIEAAEKLLRVGAEVIDDE